MAEGSLRQRLGHEAFYRENELGFATLHLHTIASWRIPRGVTCRARASINAVLVVHRAALPSPLPHIDRIDLGQVAGRTQ